MAAKAAVLDVRVFSREEAEKHGRAVGRGLRAALLAILETMRKGQEDELPLPLVPGEPKEVLLLKKLSGSRFAVRVRREKPAR